MAGEGGQLAVNIDPTLKPNVFWSVVWHVGGAPYHLVHEFGAPLLDTLSALDALATEGALRPDATDFYRLDPSGKPEVFADVLSATAPDKLISALTLDVISPKRMYEALSYAVKQEIRTRLEKLEELTARIEQQRHSS